MPRSSPVPGDQTSVRLHQGALPLPGQEHGTGADIVCAVQSVDGAPAVAAGIGINPSAGACWHHRNGEKPHIWRACRSLVGPNLETQDSVLIVQTIPKTKENEATLH